MDSVKDLIEGGAHHRGHHAAADPGVSPLVWGLLVVLVVVIIGAVVMRYRSGAGAGGGAGAGSGGGAGAGAGSGAGSGGTGGTGGSCPHSLGAGDACQTGGCPCLAGLTCAVKTGEAAGRCIDLNRYSLLNTFQVAAANFAAAAATLDRVPPQITATLGGFLYHSDVINNAATTISSNLGSLAQASEGLAADAAAFATAARALDAVTAPDAAVRGLLATVPGLAARASSLPSTAPTVAAAESVRAWWALPGSSLFLPSNVVSSISVSVGTLRQQASLLPDAAAKLGTAVAALTRAADGLQLSALSSPQ